MQKHIEEHGGGVGGTLTGAGSMIWNKLLFQPLAELWNNRDYYGKEVWDTNAPGYQQFAQIMEHLFKNQLSPMAVSGATRAQETGGRPIETALSYAGFGPAPGYVEKSAIQNRIANLYQNYVAPGRRPYEAEEVTHDKWAARNKLLMAKQRGDPEEVAAAQ